MDIEEFAEFHRRTRGFELLEWQREAAKAILQGGVVVRARRAGRATIEQSLRDYMRSGDSSASGWPDPSQQLSR